jgi:2-oxoglutarate dehydrogenase E2 component (dihydrolipoamide succinyltransferase)
MAVGSTVDVVMPQMGVSVSEGTVSRWLKGVGDRVEADESIVEISTDKVDTEVPSPASGVVAEILVPEGETVPVESRLAVIQTGDGPAPDPAAEPPAEPEAAAAGAPEAALAAAAPAERVAEPAAGAAHLANGDAGDGDQSMRTVMSPVVARMVSEHGLDVGAIAGTGRGGRVTKRDVEAHLAERGIQTAPIDTSAPAAPAPAPAAPAPAAQSAPAPVAEPPQVPSGPLEEVYRFSTIRKVIAKHMRESLDTHAHVTQIVEVDMTRVAGLRKKLKPQFEQTYGVGLSFLPFIMRSVIDGIARWPWMNADVRGDEALIRRYVNMGMAVAIDDAKGLLVPVIKNAEQLNLVGLSRAITDLAERARRKALEPDEMSGGTFTITNPGVFGTLVGTPIIPHGSVAIIDTGAVVKRPVVVSDAEGNDSIAIRSMMYLSISFDHRLVDGAYAAQFMQQVKKNLETWSAEAYGA